MNDEAEVQNPRKLHPAFYGCFDWHSSVHGHWMLVRLLKMFPDMEDAFVIRDALDQNLTARNILTEVSYLGQKNRKSFERTYGWAWLLKLAQELTEWDDEDGRRWGEHLKPLTEAIVARYIDFLPRQTYPIRTGVHPNTAFGIAFALDYARSVGNDALETLLVERALTYYQNDKDYPAAWEPGGEDFFSACLLEADLIRRILQGDEFENWLLDFLPGLKEGKPESLFSPALVSDRSDPKIVHLDGLNMSRAWCMFGIASTFPQNDSIAHTLRTSAVLHAEDALSHIASGNYEGEHWLASFAVYTLSVSEQIE